MASYLHNKCHKGKDAMVLIFNKYWHNQNFARIARSIYEKCMICQQNNQEKHVNVITSTTGKSDKPFTRVQAEFIEMPAVYGLKYMLVLICLFSCWVEVYSLEEEAKA